VALAEPGPGLSSPPISPHTHGQAWPCRRRESRVPHGRLFSCRIDTIRILGKGDTHIHVEARWAVPNQVPPINISPQQPPRCIRVCSGPNLRHRHQSAATHPLATSRTLISCECDSAESGAPRISHWAGLTGRGTPPARLEAPESVVAVRSSFSLRTPEAGLRDHGARRASEGADRRRAQQHTDACVQREHHEGRGDNARRAEHDRDREPDGESGRDARQADQ
jgi:hypothetical protein